MTANPNPPAPAEGVAATFIGDPYTNFVAGVPARDISTQEWEAMTDETKTAVAEHETVYTLSAEAAESVPEEAPVPETETETFPISPATPPIPEPAAPPAPAPAPPGPPPAAPPASS